LVSAVGTRHAETAAERGKLGCAQILIPEDQHRVLGERRLDPGESVCLEWLRQIDPESLGSQRCAEGAKSRCLCHRRSSVFPDWSCRGSVCPIPEVSHAGHEVIPTGAVLGAEIAGVDLSRQLDSATFAAIERAYDEYGVIFFRGQSITPAQQVAFTRRFGEIEFNIFGERWSVPSHPEIVVLSNVTEGGRPTGVRRAGENWHSDMCYTARPPRGTILYAIEYPRAARASAGRHRVRQRRGGLGCLAGCDEAHSRGTAGRV